MHALRELFCYCFAYSNELMSTRRSHHGFNLGFDGDIGGKDDGGATRLFNLNGS